MRAAVWAAMCLFGTAVLTGVARAGEVLVNGDFESGVLSPFTNDTRFWIGIGFSVTSNGCYDGMYRVVDTS